MTSATQSPSSRWNGTMIFYLTVLLSLLQLQFLLLDAEAVEDLKGTGDVGGLRGGADEGKVAQGWLDRVVLFYKKKFYEDVERTLPDIEIQAEIREPAPGIQPDDAAWDEQSVLRLAELLRRSSSAPLRRLMRQIDDEVEEPTRRRYMPLRPQQRQRAAPASARRNKPAPKWPVPPVPDQELWAMDFKQSFLFFPRILKDVHDYYDHQPADYEFVKKWSPAPATSDPVDPNKLIYIMNPVESRLPGHYIKVGLLKTILMERALIARQLPSTGTTRTWPSIPTRNTTASKNSTRNTTKNTTSNITKNSTRNVTNDITKNTTTETLRTTTTETLSPTTTTTEGPKP